MRNYLQQKLFRSLLPESKKIVLVRTRTSVSLADYVWWVGISVLSVLAFLTCLFGFLSLALDEKVWLAWRKAWQPFFLQFVGIRPSGAFSLALSLLDLCGFVLILTIFTFDMMRKSLRELRSIIVVTRGRSLKFVQPPGYIKWESAPYVVPEVITDLTPNEAIEIAQEKLDTWKTAIDSLLQQYPPRPTPLVSIKVILTHQIDITLVGQNGETASLLIDNEKQAELIAFLAFQPRGEWVRRRIIMTKVPGAEKESSFSMDVKRIREKISELALSKNLVKAADIDRLQKQAGPDKTWLLDNEKRKNVSYWRLAPNCETSVFPELQTMYQQAKAEEQEPAINLEERMAVLKRLVVQYGNEKGLLGTYQSFPNAWPWLEDHYKLYRTRWLFLLNNTAKRMMASIQNCPKNEQDLEALRNAALLYRWATQAANSLFASFSLQEDSETYLLNSLRCYRLLHDFENAHTLYMDYSEKRRQRDNRWQPRQKTKDEWPEVVTTGSSKARKTSKK